MKNIFYIAAFLVLGLTSCINEEEDLFDDSAANRMMAAQKECREVLSGVPNGWVVEYYAGTHIIDAEKRIGGLVFLMDFDENGDVVIASEHEGAKPAKTKVKSTYNIIADQSIVLTFDTYNDILHYFSEPSMEDLDGLGGDYEFVVMDVTPEKVVLKGRRKGNRIIMRPLAEDTNWDDYIDGVSAFKKKVTYSRFNVFVNEQRTENTVALGMMDHNLIVMGRYFPQEQENVTFSPNGMNLYSPVQIAGYAVESFTWDEAQNRLVTSVDGVTIALEGYNPEGYSTYEDYVGNYSFEYMNYSSNLTARRGGIVALNGTSTLTMTGLEFPVVLKYDNVNGSIYFEIQHVPQTLLNEYEVYLFNWLGSSGFDMDNTRRYEGKWAKNDSGRDIIIFESNSPAAGHIGMCFVAYDGEFALISENSFINSLRMVRR